MRGKAPLVGVALISILGSISCSAPEPEQDTTTPPSPTTDPKLAIKQPKNVSSDTDPCRLLTKEQLAQLGAGVKFSPENGSLGEKKCRWTGDQFNVAVSVYTQSGIAGPAGLFEGADTYDNFEPGRVAGFPAARTDAQQISCTSQVAVAENGTVAVDYYKNAGGTPEMEDPCGYAEKIATEVLKNIRDA